MHSAILVVKLPDSIQHGARQRWQAFLSSIAPLESNPALVQLGENIWLVEFQRSPAAFAQFVAACVQHQFSYGILPLADAPQWLPGGFDPRPTEDRSDESLNSSDD